MSSFDVTHILFPAINFLLLCWVVWSLARRSLGNGHSKREQDDRDL